MFERFTDRARRVVVLAQEEARLLDHNYIGTEHILLGLIHENDGVAAQALRHMNISLEEVRRWVEELIGKGGSSPSGHIPFTPRAKKVLELSLREALQLGHNYIGTEHILLGLVREGEGIAAQVLVKLGADLSRVRETVIDLLAGRAGKVVPKEVVPTRPGPLQQHQDRLTQLAVLTEATVEGFATLTDLVKAEHRIMRDKITELEQVNEDLRRQLAARDQTISGLRKEVKGRKQYEDRLKAELAAFKGHTQEDLIRSLVATCQQLLGNSIDFPSDVEQEPADSSEPPPASG